MLLKIDCRRWRNLIEVRKCAIEYEYVLKLFIYKNSILVRHTIFSVKKFSTKPKTLDKRD